MAVRSKRLFGPTGVGTGFVTLYTCPAGETALLKCLTVANTAALGNTTLFRLNGTGPTTQLFALTVGIGGADVVNELFIVLGPGDTLRASSTQTSMVVTGFGAELEGVAD